MINVDIRYVFMHGSKKIQFIAYSYSLKIVLRLIIRTF